MSAYFLKETTHIKFKMNWYRSFDFGLVEEIKSALQNALQRSHIYHRQKNRTHWQIKFRE